MGSCFYVFSDLIAVLYSCIVLVRFLDLIKYQSYKTCVKNSSMYFHTEIRQCIHRYLFSELLNFQKSCTVK